MVKLLEKFIFSLICNFPESCNLSLQEFFFFFQFKVDFKVFLNNNMGCFVLGSFFYGIQCMKKISHKVGNIWHCGKCDGEFLECDY